MKVPEKDLRASQIYWRKMARLCKSKGENEDRKFSVELALWYRDRIRKRK